MKLNQNYTDLMQSGIYCIENIKSGKKYIGSSCCIYHRLKRHLCDLRKNRHSNKILQSSFNKNGENVFIAYSIEFCSEEDLLIREEFYIGEIKPYFNIIKVKLRKPHLHEKSKKQISETLKELYKNGLKSYDHPHRKKPVVVYDLKGVFVKEYESVSSCAKDLHLLKKHIFGCLNWITIKYKNYQFREVNSSVEVFDLENVGMTKIKKLLNKIRETINDSNKRSKEKNAA